MKKWKVRPKLKLNLSLLKSWIFNKISPVDAVEEGKIKHKVEISYKTTTDILNENLLDVKYEKFLWKNKVVKYQENNN